MMENKKTIGIRLIGKTGKFLVLFGMLILAASACAAPAQEKPDIEPTPSMTDEPALIPALDVTQAKQEDLIDLKPETKLDFWKQPFNQYDELGNLISAESGENSGFVPMGAVEIAGVRIYQIYNPETQAIELATHDEVSGSNINLTLLGNTNLNNGNVISTFGYYADHDLKVGPKVGAIPTYPRPVAAVEYAKNFQGELVPAQSYVVDIEQETGVASWYSVFAGKGKVASFTEFNAIPYLSGLTLINSEQGLAFSLDENGEVIIKGESGVYGFDNVKNEWVLPEAVKLPWESEGVRTSETMKIDLNGHPVNVELVTMPDIAESWNGQFNFPDVSRGSKPYEIMSKVFDLTFDPLWKKTMMKNGVAPEIFNEGMSNHLNSPIEMRILDVVVDDGSIPGYKKEAKKIVFGELGQDEVLPEGVVNVKNIKYLITDKPVDDFPIYVSPNSGNKTVWGAKIINETLVVVVDCGSNHSEYVKPGVEYVVSKMFGMVGYFLTGPTDGQISNYNSTNTSVLKLFKKENSGSGGDIALKTALFEFYSD